MQMSPCVPAEIGENPSLFLMPIIHILLIPPEFSEELRRTFKNGSPLLEWCSASSQLVFGSETSARRRLAGAMRFEQRLWNTVRQSQEMQSAPEVIQVVTPTLRQPRVAP